MTFLEKNERIESVPKKFQIALTKVQQKAVDEIGELISSLDKKNGTIVISAENLKKINLIQDKINDVLLSKAYKKELKKYLKEISDQAAINLALLTKEFGDIGNVILADEYIKKVKKSAVASISAEMSALTTKSINIIETAVINGGSIVETIKNVTNELGSEKALSNLKKITTDAFAIADRSYTSIISDYLDAEWFFYSGVETEGTRCFCEERKGKYFYYKEIEAWGNGKDIGDCEIENGKWAGQRQGTNSKTIYSYLGGYGCADSLMPVSIFSVPKDEIQRAIDKGYYKPKPKK